MFTPKNIQGALEELYDLCDPDYMKKGIFSTVGQLPKEEPHKGSIATSAAV